MYDFVSKSFQKEHSLKNILSIQLSLNGFSFCILHSKNKKLLVLKSLTFRNGNEHLMARRLYDWYNDEELLRLPYNRTEILYFTEKFSLIPEKYESESLKKTISHLFPVEKENKYTESHIASLGAKLIYPFPSDIQEKLSDLFKNYQLIHPVQKLIPASKLNPAKENVLLFFNGGNMYFILRKKQKLFFCNTFKVNHASDATYFILTVLKQFKISIEDVSVSLCGKTVFGEELSEQLLSYFSSVDRQYPLNVIGKGIDKDILSENICLF